MQRITNEIIRTLTEANEKVILLSKMNEVPWDSLKKDTLLIVADTLDKFHRGITQKRYFSEFHQDKIYVYKEGTTSQTYDKNIGTAYVAYALPINL